MLDDVLMFHSHVRVMMQTLPTLSGTPFSLSAGMLGLLLVFRTNQSYARFDDARKLWGLLVNRTR